MTDLEKLAQWQATMDMAIYKMEKRTGLRLAGLSPSELSQKIKEWADANRKTHGGLQFSNRDYTRQKIFNRG